MDTSVQICPTPEEKQNQGQEMRKSCLYEPKANLHGRETTSTLNSTTTKLCELSNYFSFHISLGKSGINNNAPTRDKANGEAHSGETPDGTLLCKA